MVASVKSLHKNKAFTLIEVFVSIVVFSFIIGIASKNIEPVSKKFLMVNNIRHQFELIHKTNQFFLNLSKNSNYLQPGTYPIPLNSINSSEFFKSLKLQTLHSNAPDYIIGKFTSTDFQNQQIKWYVYRF